MCDTPLPHAFIGMSDIYLYQTFTTYLTRWIIMENINSLLTPVLTLSQSAHCFISANDRQDSLNQHTNKQQDLVSVQQTSADKLCVSVCTFPADSLFEYCQTRVSAAVFFFLLGVGLLTRRGGVCIWLYMCACANDAWQNCDWEDPFLLTSTCLTPKRCITTQSNRLIAMANT